MRGAAESRKFVDGVDMSQEDLDVHSLAAYLHVAPAQVMRLVERGKLPARRVSGQWRFSSAEIHHWLEERIGLSTDDELAQMESALARPAGESVLEGVLIAEMLPIEAIDIPLAAQTRGAVIAAMAELAARTGWLWDPTKMADAVRAREDMFPTALDSGVALLHPRRPLPAILDRPFIALGRTGRGIPFGGASGKLTDVFFLLCSVDDREHLRTLARLSRLLAAEEFLESLRQATGPAAAHEIIAAADAKLN